jgi:drug/metabolite transporter (DMT)-like permease
MPLFVALGSHIFVPGDQLTPAKAAGLAASFVGLGIALGDGLWGPGAEHGSIVGDLMCLASAAGWGVTTLMLRTTRLRSVSPEKALLYQLGISAPLLVAVSLAIGEAPISLSKPSVVVAFAYSVVIVAFISYTVWFWLLSRHSASSVAVFTFLTPLFGVLAAHLLLEETLTSNLLAAMALVAIGIYLVNRPSARPEA